MRARVNEGKFYSFMAKSMLSVDLVVCSCLYVMLGDVSSMSLAAFTASVALYLSER